ncbi:hypothetical protein Bca101_094722 [Brassica carinata]
MPHQQRKITGKLSSFVAVLRSLSLSLSGRNKRMASLNLRCDSTHLFPSRDVTRTRPFRKTWMCPKIIPKRLNNVRMGVMSEEGGVFSSSSSKSNNGSMGIELQPDLVSFGTLAAEMIPTTMVSSEEFDLDRPTDGFASIPQAIEDIRQGKLVIVVDDEDRENEGDLIMAASLVTPEAMAFVVKHGTGIVCVSMKGEDLERLELPLMVTRKENEEKLRTAFTVSVDAKNGTSTGVSARDRAQTILALASKDSKPQDFNRPGHIFPLRYRDGGVLKRAGHTEASVDLTVLAGLEPVSVLCEIVDDDGSMARLPRLRQFAQENNLKIISIADLIRYRRKRERLVEFTAVAPIPTMWGPFKAYCFKSLLDGVEHIAMVKGEVGDGKDVLVRVHAECITDDIFGNGSGGKQLAIAMRQIEETGRGVFVYLRGPEANGIDLTHKPRTYDNTSDQTEGVSFPVASREYGIGAQILRDLGVRTMKVMTNNPAHYVGLKGYGLSITGKDLTVVGLLAEKTKEVDVVAHSYTTVGEIVPLIALLIVAVDKIRVATLFGAAVFSESVDKQTSQLFSILQAGDEALLELLINTDIDVNETDAEGNTTLHCCLKGSSVPHKQQTSVEQLLVLGGNGFVGSHVCKEALDRGLSVSSLSRSGRSSVQESWASRVTWHQGTC